MRWSDKSFRVDIVIYINIESPGKGELSMACIGIRKEDKNRWEARAPLTPDQVGRLVAKGMDVYVESSGIRAFSDREYEEAGATITDDLKRCPIIFGVKEIPPRYFHIGNTLICFSHTVKGQDYNMPVLWEMMANQCNLIDYERIADDSGKRLVFFGDYAGYAGMVDSLWALGKRLEHLGYSTPFASVKKAVKQEGMGGVRDAMKKLSEDIASEGIPDELKPLVIGFTGYGNVSQKAQELVDMLPVTEVKPQEIFDLDPKADTIYKVVFKEEHIVQPNSHETFDLQGYYDEPGKYYSVFARYIPYLTVLMNCTYWDNPYPRLVTKDRIRQLHVAGEDKLQVIGDISCDIDGGVECNTHVTTPGEPVYTYDPISEETNYGVQGKGPVVLAVDNLPCELPKESTEAFGEQLMPFVEHIASADYSKPFEELDMPEEIKRAFVLYQGELTPSYAYLEKYLDRGE